MNTGKLLINLILSLFILGCSQSKQLSSWQLGTFSKPKENPILGADSTKKFYCPVNKDTVRWQRADVFNPGAIVKDNKVYMLTRCEDNPAARLGRRTSRLGLAVSDDGIHFTHFDKPVLYPDNDAFQQYDFPGGCEDPRVVETEDGTYVVAYTSWNYKVPRLSIAFSKDLMKWEKKGPAFAKAYDGKYKDIASKSASIITKMKNNRPVVAKIDGKYWMYWGERFVNLAWSDNLYDWYPLEDDKGEMKKIITPRANYFDSDLTECGPPALITKNGILLMYNGKNSTNQRADPKLPKGTYSVGLVLFDKNNPEKVLQRTDTCILKPNLPHEISGQYKAGTTFSEGLVFFQKKWFLYYGTADSYIGVAVSEGL